MMYYGAIKNFDIANGPGVRVTLFVSGCTNHCRNCFQPETWAFDYGSPFTSTQEDEIISLLQPSYIEGLSLLGGDPFEPANQGTVLHLVKRVREACPGKNIWAYSGFTYDAMKTDGAYPRCADTDELLSLLDVLVDGPFIDEQKNLSLAFRGSENQRVIDLPRTLRSGNVVLWQS